MSEDPLAEVREKQKQLAEKIKRTHPQSDQVLECVEELNDLIGLWLSNHRVMDDFDFR